MKIDKQAIFKEEYSKEMSRRGKISANSPIRTKEYYSNLGRKSAASKRKRKNKDQSSVSSVVSNILTGQI